MTQELHKPPYFSVIIPTLNEEKFVPRLLKNLNTQTFKDFEVTIVDGESQDKTAELVQNFPASYPLTLITTDKHNVSYQRNLGAARSRAKVLIFFDADTQIPKNFLDKIYHIFETKRPHFCTTYMQADTKKPSETWFTNLTNITIELGRITKTPLAYGAMQAIKRTVFEDIEGYDEETKFGEDSQLFQKASDYNYKYYVAPHPRYIFSLRRLRAEGTIDMMTRYLKLNLSNVLNGYHNQQFEYIMGGHHSVDIRKPDQTTRFNKLFKRLRSTTKSQADSIKTIIENLFPL